MIKNRSLLLSLSTSLILGVLFGHYLFGFYTGSFLTNLLTEPNASKAIDISLASFESDVQQANFHLPPVVATKRNIDKVLSSKQIRGRLETLTIEATDLKILENKVNHLSNLSRLSLIDCTTHHQPLSIYKLTTLTYLELGNCNLETINPEIVNLSNLTFLKLYKNNLSSIPSEISFLTKLEFLDLRDNNLSSIPPFLYQMNNLKKVFLEGNKINKTEIKLFQEFLTNKQVSTEKNFPTTSTE